MDEIKQKAHFYWQDSLAKFFPNSKGPSSVELDMFRAGYEARDFNQEVVTLTRKLESAHNKIRRMREQRKQIRHLQKALATWKAFANLLSKSPILPG